MAVTEPEFPACEPCGDDPLLTVVVAFDVDGEAVGV
jgi:hypothetical protein